MSATTYLHAKPNTTASVHRQSDGTPALHLDSPGFDLTVFGPTVDRHGPAAVIAFAEALADAAAEFLAYARTYANEDARSAWLAA